MNYSSYRRIKGVYLRYYYDLINDIQSAADMFYWPLVDIILWGLTSQWIKSQAKTSDTHIALMIMTGLIFWQIVWRGSIDISLNLLKEFWCQNLVNLFSTPLKISEWSIGVLCLCLLKLLLTVLFGAGVVYMLYSLNIFSVGWSFIPLASMLIVFGWAIGFITAGLIINYGPKIQTLAWVMPFIFAPFSAVFYPVETLPGWAQIIAWSLPTTYVFEGMRQILSGSDFPSEYFLKSILLNLIFLISAALFFKRMFERSREKGLARLM